MTGYFFLLFLIFFFVCYAVSSNIYILFQLTGGESNIYIYIFVIFSFTYLT